MWSKKLILLQRVTTIEVQELLARVMLSGRVKPRQIAVMGHEFLRIRITNSKHTQDICNYQI